jgi:hypothetical protein
METACIRNNNDRCYGTDGDNMLFKCVDGFPVNTIDVEDAYCGKCMNGGSGKSDYC